MSYPTYKDLCINVLLRLGEDKNVNAGVITQTTTIAGYLKTIPDLLFEALNILSTAGKYIPANLSLTKTTDEIESFDLKQLAPFFFKLGRVYRDNEPFGKYRFDGDRYFTVSLSGTYQIFYDAYPQDLSGLNDNTEIYVDPEVYAILPLYIEGKLRQINDEDYAMSILNEFEQRRAELIQNNANGSQFVGVVTVSHYDRAVGEYHG